MGGLGGWFFDGWSWWVVLVLGVAGSTKHIISMQYVILPMLLIIN